ncbi:MAG: efflux transporter periplasmic adaptor subunit [Rhodocyclales bacterium GWA2_65_20]|nr:MAG: efflux transporter periplasmic adaptor subunit [Rhodocyclales bacterium GWA2_65_20]
MKTSAFLPLLCAAALAACSEPPPPAAAVPVVKTLIAGEAPAAGARTYSGEVRARHETTLAFRVGGKIVERSADVGAVVKAGQILARLDPADLALQAGQAEAQRALADADARRYRDLRGRNFVSQSALDAKETALEAAQAQAALAKNQAAYAVLKADKPGAIAQVLAEPGQVVAAGQGVFRLAEAGETEVAIAVPEAQLADLKPGAAAEVVLWTGRQPLRGRLRELAPVADAATRTYPARISLLDRAPGLALGMTASVRFRQEAADALTVPLAAIFQQERQPAVWVVAADDTVSLRAVSVAAYTDAGATIAEGLKSGERIVAAGVHKLSAGQKVRPVK